MTKEFNCIDEIKKYYVKESNTYVFKENNEYIDLIVFNFDLDIDAGDINAWNIHAWNINAGHIHAWNINAGNIHARDINARDINAGDISFYSVCVSYNNIHCNTIISYSDKYIIKALDGEVYERKRQN